MVLAPAPISLVEQNMQGYKVV